MSEIEDVSGLMDGVLRAREGRPGQHEAYLPSPCPQNHAANLMQLPDDTLACVWFGGTQEGMADISIHISRLEPGATRWSETIRLIDDPSRSEQNPILFPAPDGLLWLFYTSQKSGHQDTAIVRRRVSADCGLTWSDPQVMIGDAGTFVRQPIFTRANGDLLLGTFLCRTTPGTKWVGDNDISAMRISSDGGRQWQTVAVPQSLGCVHMNIVEAATGELLALFRSRWADFIHQSRSLDDGSTWSVPRPTVLPNNNSSIQATRLNDGRLALVYNHSSAADATDRRLSLYDEIDDDEEVMPNPAALPQTAPTRTAFWGAPRAPLVLALSDDGGHSWPTKIELDTGDGYCLTNNSTDRRNRELSYPSIHQTRDGRIHVAYTYHRQAIKHVTIDVI